MERTLMRKEISGLSTRIRREHRFVVVLCVVLYVCCSVMSTNHGTFSFLGVGGEGLVDVIGDWKSCATVLCQNVFVWNTHKDFSKLKYATGLKPMEKEMVGNFTLLTQKLPGTQQVRLLMGHHLFGAGISYGTALFWTISPNASQSALCIRLSRFLPEDPYVTEKNSKGYPFQPWIGMKVSVEVSM